MTQNQMAHDREREQLAAEELELEPGLLSLRIAIFGMLAAQGIDHVNVDYSGSNDEGYVNNIEFVTADNRTVNMSSMLVVWLDEDGDQQEETIRQAIEDLCWDHIIKSQWDGFENDEGGSGAITFHVSDRRISWYHEERVITVEEHNYEL